MSGFGGSLMLGFGWGFGGNDFGRGLISGIGGGLISGFGLGFDG